MAYEFSCVDAGAACRAHLKADTQEELVEKVADHLKNKHKVQHVTNTLANYAIKVAKER
ncbi:MAG: DUF1059 domain-containing protein [Actinomycetota bacterium]|nr:DUF1059 domain-containing protein [Actinomycetota bacterium]